MNEDETKYDSFYSNSKTEKIPHKFNIDNKFESIYSIIMTKRRKYHADGSDWTINWLIE